MRVLLQRVQSGKVTVGDRLVGAIGTGLVILVGVAPTDGETQAQFMADKVVNLRIFEDAQGKMNLSLLDVRGSALVVSQFTLYADARKGRRPSFTNAAPPDQARPLVERFITLLAEKSVPVQTGEFGAHMLVDIANDGPVTIWLEAN